MDWLWKFFNYKGRPREDDNPFRSLTWEEIVKQRDLKDLQDSEEMQHPWGHSRHGGFPNTDMFLPHQELLGQMDDMFSKLEDMMREMHRHPAWELPDLPAEPEPQTPRDFMLKVPDNDQTMTVPAPTPHHPLHRPEDEMLDSSDDSSQHIDPFSFSPHSFFDGIFQQFGMDPSKTPFPDNLPGSNPEEHSRESLMKKEDNDIDDRVLGDLSKLPEGGPGYSHRLPQIFEPRRAPWSHPESPGSPNAGIRHKFYSQSVVTIRRPDGSIEETKKYSDSTGREEVIVTHKQPEDENRGVGALLPDEPVDQRPSLFSWFFTR